MKLLIPLMIFTAYSNMAHAHPGGHRLTCKSAKNSGSNQRIDLSLARSNGKGWHAPTIEVGIDNKKLELFTPDDMENYGTTFHNSPLKVITVTAEVSYDGVENTGNLTIVGIPSTVKAFDMNNKPVKWSFEAEKDECNDTNGRATFQGILNGHLYEGKESIEVDTQILDCELTYGSGMTC